MTIAIQLFLGLVVLVLFDAAAVLRRHRSRFRAVLAAITGVGLLATTVWALWPALTDTQAAALRVQLASSEQTIAGLSSEKQRLADDIMEAARNHTRDLADLSADVAQVRRALTSGPNAFAVDAPTATAPAARERLRADVLSLSTLRVPQGQAAPAATIPTRDLDVLKGQMAARMTTPSYDIEAYPDRELIRGRTGRYYIVDMKNASSGVRFFFDGGKYTLSRSSQDFRSSLNTFIAEVLAKFEGKLDYALFVRGSADQKPYEGAFETGAEFRRIPYVRALGHDKYGIDLAERRIEGRVRNADLPDLRAAFMQRIVAETYPTKPPTILEGAVSPKTDNRDRNVELILYVDW
jgi:hypothetical protein